MILETQESDDGVVYVRLTGRMDIAGVDGIGVPFAGLAATDSRRVIVDLSGVEFMASIGIRAILQNARAHRMRGGAMVLVAPLPLVREVLEAAGVHRLVPIASDAEAARAMLVA